MLPIPPHWSKCQGISEYFSDLCIAVLNELLDGLGEFHRACKLLSIEKVLVVSTGVTFEVIFTLDLVGISNLSLLDNKLN